MGIRDLEISRLVKYAESLGVHIKFEKHKKGLPGAMWELSADNSRTIIVYEWSGISKTTIILNLLHELAHEKSYIKQNRKLDINVLNAITKHEDHLDKSHRKIIYEMEKADAIYRLEIAHELDIRIPKSRIINDIKLDLFIYRYFYLKGIYPTTEEINRYAKKKRKK